MVVQFERRVIGLNRAEVRRLLGPSLGGPESVSRWFNTEFGQTFVETAYRYQATTLDPETGEPDRFVFLAFVEGEVRVVFYDADLRKREELK